MALQVWLPLNGDLKNKGCADVTVTNNGATVDNNGKIGQCYKFGTSASYVDIPKEAMNGFSTEASVCFWLKINTFNTAWATYFQAGLTSTAWTHYIFGFLRNNSTSKCCFAISDTSTSSQTSYLTPDLSTGVWYHFAITYKPGHCCIYVNGTLYQDYSTSITADFSKITRITLGKCNNRSSYQTDCYMNDFRIYDHCLSAAEVKEISRGLVLHYKLDDPLVGVKFYDYLQSTGTQWIDTGVKGYMNHTYEIDFQQTDTGNYRIWGTFGQSSYVGYNMSLTYGTGWIARWNSTSNGQELVRLGTIDTNRHTFKVINGQCYFDNVSKGVSTSHDSNFSIDNNLFLFTINPANTTPSSNSKCKIYSYKDIDLNGKLIRYMVPCTYNGVAGMWDMVENQFYGNAGSGTFTLGTQLPSDTTIIDSSGYGNTGIITGEALANLNSPRYSATILTTNVSSYSTITCSNLSLPDGPVTLSFWSKPTVSDTVDTSKIEIRFSNCWYFTYANYTYFIHNGDYKYRWTNPWSDGNWHLVTGVFDGTNTKIYVDGIEATVRTGTETTTNTFRNALTINFRGNSISDFRIYSTALSADDIKQLYEVSAKIDNKQRMHSYEFTEEISSVPKILKTGETKCNELTECAEYVYFPANSYIRTGVSYAVGDTCKVETVIRYETEGSTRDLMGFSIGGGSYWGVTAAGAWEPHGTFTYTNTDITKKNSISYTYTSISTSGEYNIGAIPVGYYSTRNKYIYSVKIYKNNELLREMYPDNNGTTSGMTDVLHGVFYTVTNGATFGKDEMQNTKLYKDRIESNELIEI